MSRMGDLANAFDVPDEQSTNVGWANRMGEILTTRPTYDEQTVLHKTASPLVNITEGDIGRATEAAMGVSGGGMKVETPRGIRAYHSSPHDFDKFDLAKIGSGEGAQAYGHGLYFAESPAVSGQGGQYWNQFLNKFRGPESSAAAVLQASKFDREAALALASRRIDDLHAEIRGGRLSPDDAINYQALLDKRLQERDLLASGKPVGPRTYEVNINADPAHMLDWDKPLREQAASVLDIARGADISAAKGATKGRLNRFRAGDEQPEYLTTGQDLYRAMADYGEGAARGSAALREAGIPGIKYLDQGSRITSPVAERILEKAGSRAEALKVAEERLRTAGMGDLSYWDSMVKQFQPETSNYVIFDPNLIRIDKKYAVPGALTAGGMGALAAQDEYSQ